MVEIFKTNVTTPEEAHKVLDSIRGAFTDHDGNFDLQDCDHILRVTTKKEVICPESVIKLLASAGHHAEVLADKYESVNEVLQMP